MRLLLINYEFPPIGAGASTATYHIGKELAAMGNTVTILTSSYRNLPYKNFQDGMQIFRCPSIRKKKSESNILEMLVFVTSAFCMLPFLIKKRRIRGIIVFFGFPCGPLGLWANILFKTPYIISLRGGDVPGTDTSMDTFHQLLTPIRRMVYKRSHAVVANSEGLKKISQKTDPVPTVVIPNGVDTEYFRPSRQQTETNAFSFIFVGRLSEQKNLYFLFEQFSKFKKESSKPFMIHIVGDGPLKNKLQHVAGRLGISSQIKWHGWLTKPQILTILQTSDCFINPSLCEGMPNAVLEAMACGLPVIASNVAGNNAVVVDGENGFLFNLGDSGKMIDSLKRIMDTPDLGAQIGKNGKDKVIDAFTWRDAARAYRNIFCQSLLHEKDF